MTLKWESGESLEVTVLCLGGHGQKFESWNQRLVNAR